MLVSFILAVGSSGCYIAHPPTWGDRTRELNRAFLVEAPPNAPARTMIYRESGNQNSDLTAIMIHGLGGSKVEWREVAPRLEDKYRVVVVDLIGQGDSTRPLDFDYSIRNQAQSIHKLMDYLGSEHPKGKFVLVGHCYGGVVALEVARDVCQDGDGGCGPLAGLVLMDVPTTKMDLHWYLRTMDPLKALVTGISTPRQSAKLLLWGASWDKSSISREQQEEYTRIYRMKYGWLTGWRAGNGLLRYLDRTPEQVVEQYDGIRCPITLIWGNDDPVVIGKTATRNLRAALEHTGIPRLALIENCGHSPAEERPVETAKLIRAFLDTDFERTGNTH